MSRQHEDPIIWYTRNRPLYESFTKEVYDIIIKILKDEGIQTQSIQHRTKSIESFRDKLENIDYEPNQIRDFSGVRIIVYVKGDIERIESIIRGIFAIDEAPCKDKTKSLGIDRVGYRSVHIVASFPTERTKLIEYRKFEGLFFEVQITTMLGHAWAEIEHDRNYKFSGKLPDSLQRRFRLLAGVLEMMDNEFESISNEVEKYRADVVVKTQKGDLKSVEIDSTSLMQYLTDKFGDLQNIKRTFGESVNHSPKIIEELNSLGLYTLADLEKIIPKTLKDEYVKDTRKHSFIGLMRDIMVIYDAKRYFESAWKRSYRTMPAANAKFLKNMGVDLDIVSNHVEIYKSKTNPVKLSKAEIRDL